MLPVYQNIFITPPYESSQLRTINKLLESKSLSMRLPTSYIKQLHVDREVYGRFRDGCTASIESDFRDRAETTFDDDDIIPTTTTNPTKRLFALSFFFFSLSVRVALEVHVACG